MTTQIGEYALIGDCRTAALVSRDGSIDWACFPRFDSPSTFARILDEARGGSFRVVPSAYDEIERRYLDDTNVLVTTFRGEAGVLEVVDCMPVDEDGTAGDGTVFSSILRRLRCVEGTVDVGVAIAPRFEYGALVPAFRLTSATTGLAVGGADALWITATDRLEWQEEALSGGWRLEEGDVHWLHVAWTPSTTRREDVRHPTAEDLEAKLEATTAFWRSWIAGCTYAGEHPDEVRRSALVLKALQYGPTGAVVAAPTTSLPEHLGGERNWDYRYTWIRDATLTLTSLFVLGFSDEADAFKGWIERTSAGRPRDLQIMYGIRGERLLPEFTLDHLDGHRGSRPVRVGNGAARQVQLDVYGQIMQAAWLYVRADGRLSRRDWAFLSELAEIVSERWSIPDQGIWEVRGPPRHFTHSKLNCWMALDKAIRLSQHLELPGPTARWEGARDRIREYLLTECAPDGWFRQAADVDAPDAAALLVPAFGLLPATHPMVQRTVAVVMEQLATPDGLVDRYEVTRAADDGLAGGEGAFLLCSFWLLDCLTYSGRLQEADRLLARLLELSNDVGLYAEEADHATGEALGNFPQAFTHMALVTSCGALSAARRGELRYDEPVDFAEQALDRMLSLRNGSPRPMDGRATGRRRRATAG
jgi:GH15 family glucan-1,4-alpha-glucosidase